MHRLILCTLALCAIILSASMAAAAVDAPANNLRLGPPDGMKATKTLVDFSHVTHDAAKVECVTCHHTWDGTSDVKSCSASGCHDQPGKRGENTFYSAFHDKRSDKSCLGCHKTAKKAGNKKVPTSCKSCHP